MTRPGIRPGGRPLFCFAKKEAKKATPMIAPRCAGFPCRRRLKRARLNSLRFAPLKQTPHLIRFRHRRHGAINGDLNGNVKSHGHVNGNVKSHGNVNGNVKSHGNVDVKSHRNGTVKGNVESHRTACPMPSPKRIAPTRCLQR
jgi:hypothetical protein